PWTTRRSPRPKLTRMPPANARNPTGKPVRGRPELDAEAVVAPLPVLVPACAVAVEDVDAEDDEPLELPLEFPPELPLELLVECEPDVPPPARGSVYWPPPASCASATVGRTVRAAAASSGARKARITSVFLADGPGGPC